MLEEQSYSKFGNLPNGIHFAALGSASFLAELRASLMANGTVIAKQIGGSPIAKKECCRNWFLFW